MANKVKENSSLAKHVVKNNENIPTQNYEMLHAVRGTLEILESLEISRLPEWKKDEKWPWERSIVAFKHN